MKKEKPKIFESDGEYEIKFWKDWLEADLLERQKLTASLPFFKNFKKMIDDSHMKQFFDSTLNGYFEDLESAIRTRLTYKIKNKQMVKFDIITFGGAVVDAFVYTNVHEVHKEMCYPIGAKIAIDKLHFRTGGAGTNTAVSFSKLGLKTGSIIKVGTDGNSELILKELKSNHIAFLGKQEKGQTDFSIILDSKEHDRTILTYKEKSNNISQKDFKLQKTDWFYFSATDNQSLQSQKSLVNFAKKNKVKIAYNPSSYLTKKGTNYIKQILNNAEILILNNEEAKDLIPDGDLFKGLHALGPKIVCITYGKEGNKVSEGTKILTAFPRKIKIVERTGAGDAFASGFVAGIIQTNNIETAIKMGSLNAESVIQHAGAKIGLLSKKEISHQLQTIKIKIA